MDNNELPGLGLIPTPELPQYTPILFAYGITPFDWTKMPNDDAFPGPDQFDVPDKEQGSGGTCTAQSEGYGLFYSTQIDTSRNDPYSNVFLPPQGGAYLDAPEFWIDTQGYLPLTEYPDPNPETEANMEQKIILKDGQGRIRTFSVKTYIINPISIDAAAEACMNHSYVKLGIAGSWEKGWNGSWTDPEYQGYNNWQHALFACRESVVIRNGKKAIKCKSSWTEHKDPLGQPSYAHYINEDYFNADGVFELLAVDVREIPMNEIVYTIAVNGKAGLMFLGGFGANIVFSNNEAHYQEMGDAYGKQTCSPDPANPGKWIFAPFDITMTVPPPPPLV